MVIDDEYANDPTKKAAMRMAKPSGVALSIISEETALANFTAGKYDDHTVFVVARAPQTIQNVIETGHPVPELVVGGTVAPAEGQAGTQVSRRAFIADDDLACYRAIAATGCKVFSQYIPADKPEALDALIG